MRHRFVLSFRLLAVLTTLTLTFPALLRADSTASTSTSATINTFFNPGPATPCNQTGPTGLTKYQEYQLSGQRDKYNDNQMTKEFHVANTAYQQLQEVAPDVMAHGSTAKDNLLLKTFARIDNPGMGVRESTVEMEMKNPGVFPGWFEDMWNKVAGGGVLNPQQRQQIIDAAQEAHKGNVNSFLSYQNNEVLPQAVNSIGGPQVADPRKVAAYVFGNQPSVFTGGGQNEAPGQPNTGGQIPDGAIQMLQKNPSLAPAFDAKYGQGSSASYLKQ